MKVIEKAYLEGYRRGIRACACGGVEVPSAAWYQSETNKDAERLEALLEKWETLSKELYKHAAKEADLGFREEAMCKRIEAAYYKKLARELREAIEVEPTED